MKIYSIFSSINGEINCRGQGSWATFVRFAGCSLGCTYCDTKYAQDPESGKEFSVPVLVNGIESLGVPYVMITGGEPLEQKDDFIHLVQRLKTRGFHITVETNGTYELPDRETCEVDCYVVDYKLPHSAGVLRNFCTKNMGNLTNRDFIKFVISKPFDYDESKLKYKQLMNINAKPRIAFSPDLSSIEPGMLYHWMVIDKLWDVQLSLQLHKIVQLPEPR